MLEIEFEVKNEFDISWVFNRKKNFFLLKYREYQEFNFILLKYIIKKFCLALFKIIFS